MGRHKQIETILLRELTLGEERAKRALTVIQYQQITISDLEKSLQEQEKLCEQLYGNGKGPEEYERIQTEVLELQESLKQLKEIQSQLLPDGGAIKVSKVAASGDTIEVSVQTSEVGDNEGVSPRILKSQTNSSEYLLENLIEDMNSIKECIETVSEKDTFLKRKLEALRQKVKWLKSERDEVITFLCDFTEWRQRVEGILLDLSAGIKEDVGKVDTEDIFSDHTRLIWRTARKFFTADEAHFFLS